MSGRHEAEKRGDMEDSGEYGPLEWAEPIHGALVVVSRDQAASFVGYERGSGLPGRVVVEGVVSVWESGGASVLVLHSPDEWACTGCTTTDGAVLIVTHLGGVGSADLLQAARDLSADAFQDTGEEFRVGTEGLAIFDGTASWDMVEQGLHVSGDAPAGTYRLQFAAECKTAAGRLRLLRLQRC